VTRQADKAGTIRSVVVGSAMAVMIFGTVPLAQLAARHAAHAGQAATAAHPVVDRIGAGVTNFVASHTHISVALAAATR
jgi:hypothetical protein